MDFWLQFSKIYEVKCNSKKPKAELNREGINILNLSNDNTQQKDLEIYSVIFPDGTKQIIMNSILEKMP
jgi:hypothetical protein